jgi:hypothetical protein
MEAVPGLEGQTHVTFLWQGEMASAPRTQKPINRDAFHSRLRPYYRPANRAYPTGDEVGFRLGGQDFQEFYGIIIAVLPTGAA